MQCSDFQPGDDLTFGVDLGNVYPLRDIVITEALDDSPKLIVGTDVNNLDDYTEIGVVDYDQRFFITNGMQIRWMALVYEQFSDSTLYLGSFSYTIWTMETYKSVSYGYDFEGDSTNALEVLSTASNGELAVSELIV